MAPATSMPEHVVGHYFVCRNTITNAMGEVILNKGEDGEIREFKNWNSGIVRIRVHSRPDKPVLLVSIANLDVGAVRQSGTSLPIRFQGAVHVTKINRPAPGKDQFNAPGDIRKHVSKLLTGIYEAKSKLPKLDSHQSRWIEDDIAIKNTSTAFRDNIRRCSPRLLDTLAKNDFDIDDIVASCVQVSPSNHTAGCYLRVYSNFKKGTSWYGRKPYIYVGQTNDMANRQDGHRGSTDNPNDKYYDTYHYQIARAAQKTVMIQLCEHNENEGGSDARGKALRDVMEQLFFLFLSSYSHRALEWRERTATKELAQAVAEQYENRELCLIYTDIAKLALSETGFAYPGKPGRAKDFGVDGGCNYLSPLGGGYSTYEKRLWAVQDLGDRWIMQRSAIVLAKAGELFNLHHAGNGITILIERGKDADLQPKQGETIYTSWEVMKPGHGEHAVPYFRNATIGPYDNWTYANKVAFKAIWRSKSDNKWHVRMYQQTRMNRHTEGGNANGWNSYALGIAMYAYLTRGVWPQAPSFVPYLGRASLISVNVNKMDQVVDLAVMTGSLVNLKGPIFSLEAARKQMRDAGFQNVDGAWQHLDWSWLDDPSCFSDGKLPAALQRAPFKARKNCDFCRVANSKSGGKGLNCERSGSTNRCTACIKRGLPCSWSSMPTLHGKNFLHLEKGNQSRPAILESVVEMLWKKDYNTRACTTVIIPDPGFKDTGKLD